MREHRCRHRVIYGDTDAMQVVYYGNYLRFFEIGRNELIRAAGLPYREIEARGYALPVTEVAAKYLQPARYDDDLEIVTRIQDLRRASISFAYQVTRADSGVLLCEGSTRHACLMEGRVVRFPEEVLATLGS